MFCFQFTIFDTRWLFSLEILCNFTFFGRGFHSWPDFSFFILLDFLVEWLTEFHLCSENSPSFMISCALSYKFTVSFSWNTPARSSTQKLELNKDVTSGSFSSYFDRWCFMVLGRKAGLGVKPNTSLWNWYCLICGQSFSISLNHRNLSILLSSGLICIWWKAFSMSATTAIG